MTENYSNLMGLSAYDILGVPPDADVEQINGAYKKQILTAHTDKPTGNDVFAKLLNAARDALLGNRAAYDSFLEKGGAVDDQGAGGYADTDPADAGSVDFEQDIPLAPDPWDSPDSVAPDLIDEIVPDSNPRMHPRADPPLRNFYNFPPPMVAQPAPTVQYTPPVYYRKRRKWPWVLLVLVALFVVFASQAQTRLTGGGGGSSVSTQAADSLGGGGATANGGDAPLAADPSTALAQQVEADRSDVESRLVDQWVPQVSSQRIGAATDDNPGNSPDVVMANHQQWRATYPDARLVWSGDWPTFRSSDYWVTIIGVPYATSAEANAWCDSQSLGPDDCFAKRLSRSGDPADNTVQR